MADMMNKFVLFLAVDGFDSESFEPLWLCFGNLNASTRIASFHADDEIRDMQGRVNTYSDMSFAEAAEQRFDVLVVADGVTANAIRGDLAAKTALMNASDWNSAIVSVEDAAIALIAAGIVEGQSIAAPPELKEQLENAGASLSDESIAISNNIFSARKNADMQSLCFLVSEYITSLGRGVAA
ncbi:MAG: DJ-1/PfpI family protein [Actinomycetota bacterium]|nr:DJ-1/PfpI family protein [Actinomycetota bacterium]